MPAATTSVNGYLSSTDWTTFNNKAPTASPSFTGNVGITTGSITLSEAWQLQWGNGSTYINGSNTDIYSNAGNIRIFTGTATKFTVNPSTASSSTTTGALVVNGGVGIAGDVFAGGAVKAVSFKFSDGTTQTTAASGAPTLVIVTTTTQTAVAGNHYVLTNVAASTITLPASPVAGDIVWVTVGNGLTTNIMARNGSNLIMGMTEDMTMNNANANYQMRYINATLGWRIM